MEEISTSSIMLETINTLSLRLSAAVYAFALTATPAFAQDIFGPTPDIGTTATDTDTLRDTAIEILQTILSFMALVAVIFIVIAGIRLVVSQGEEGEKDKAKKTIIYVIVGLIVILFAKAIVSLVEDVFLA